MTALAKKLGVDVRTLCPATGLMNDGTNVTGVYYSDHNDNRTEHAITAKGVFLASGGYACNKDMFESFTMLDHNRLYNFGAQGATGDGITWARALGADTHNPSTVMFACTYVPETQMFEDKVNWMFSWQPNLRVNQAGIRFMNEQMATDFSIVSNSVLTQTTAYSVIDYGFLERVENVALPMGLDSVGYHTGQPLPGVIDAVEKGVADGKVFKGETIAELAQNMGLDVSTFVETVTAYNGYAAAGVDPVFSCPPSAMAALQTGPFYAAEIMPAYFTSVGGLRVDESWHVLRPDASPIKGLYALGNDASSQVGHDYDVGVMSGSQQGWCATGGRLAVEDVLL
jgi:fumarate reductase flavoprotein subunit